MPCSLSQAMTARRSFAPNRQHVCRVSAGRFTTLFRSEEHTSELQSLMRLSYAVFCSKKKKATIHTIQEYKFNIIKRNTYTQNKRKDDKQTKHMESAEMPAIVKRNRKVTNIESQSYNNIAVAFTDTITNMTTNK